MFGKIFSTLYYSRLPQDMGITFYFFLLSLAVLVFSAQSMKALIELTGNFPVEKYAEYKPKLAECYFIKQPLCLFTV